MLRLPLALGVVFIHLNLRISGGEIDWLAPTRMDAFRMLKCVVTDELSSVAVPLFFFVSGYLFFFNIRWDAATYINKLKRRSRSLLLPYMLFNTLAALGLIINYSIDHHSLWAGVENYMGGLRWLRNYWDIHTNGVTVNFLGERKPISYPIDVPLWFMRDLMVVMLMSPLWYFLLKRLDWLALVLLTTFCLMGIWIPVVGFSGMSSMLFCFGGWFGIRGRSVAFDLAPLRRWIVVAAFLLMVADIFFIGTSAHSRLHFLFRFIAVPAIYVMVSGMPLWGGRVADFLLKHSGGASFFVFATHTLPLPIIGCRPVEWCKGLIWSNSSNPWVCGAEFFAMAFATMIICLLAYFLLLRICPNVLSFVIGRTVRK